MAVDGMKRKVFFLPKMDVALITEVLKHNPFKNGNAVYGTIAEHLKKSKMFRDVARRNMQERVERLLKSFQSDQLQNRGWSGTVKEYQKRERLLQELSDLQKEWATRKREAAPTPTPSAVRHNPAADLHDTVGRSIMDREATPLQPVTTSTAVEEVVEEGGEEVEVEVVVEEEQGAESPAVKDHQPEQETSPLDDTLPTQEQDLQGDALPLRTPPPPPPPPAQMEQGDSGQIAALWMSTLNFMSRKLETDAEAMEAALDIQIEELVLDREALEIANMLARNERLRIQAEENETARRAGVEEERQKQEREERRLQQDRQDGMMDAILQLLHHHNNKK